MKAGDLVKIRADSEGAYHPDDLTLGKIGVVTENLKNGHMAWILWPGDARNEVSMAYPDDLEIVSAAPYSV
jgi:hypothetical protein